MPSARANFLTLNGEGVPSDAAHSPRAGSIFAPGTACLTRARESARPSSRSPWLRVTATLRGPPSADVAVLDSAATNLRPTRRTARRAQIPASNGAMLAAMAAPLPPRSGASARCPIAWRRCSPPWKAPPTCDVIVTSGGASVGDHDLVRPALEQWGADIDFWRVAIKPGKPLLVARKGRRWCSACPATRFELRHRVPVPAAAAAPARRAPPTRCPARCSCRSARRCPQTGDRPEFRPRPDRLGDRAGPRRRTGSAAPCARCLRPNG